MFSCTDTLGGAGGVDDDVIIFNDLRYSLVQTRWAAQVGVMMM